MLAITTLLQLHEQKAVLEERSDSSPKRPPKQIFCSHDTNHKNSTRTHTQLLRKSTFFGRHVGLRAYQSEVYWLAAFGCITGWLAGFVVGRRFIGFSIIRESSINLPPDFCIYFFGSILRQAPDSGFFFGLWSVRTPSRHSDFATRVWTLCPGWH